MRHEEIAEHELVARREFVFSDSSDASKSVIISLGRPVRSDEDPSRWECVVQIERGGLRDTRTLSSGDAFGALLLALDTLGRELDELASSRRAGDGATHRFPRIDWSLRSWENCSFCGRTKDEVAGLGLVLGPASAPGLAICERCADLCCDAFAMRQDGKPKAGAGFGLMPDHVVDLAVELSIATVSLREWFLTPELVGLIPRDIAERRTVIAIAQHDSVILLAMANPRDTVAISEVEAVTRCRVDPAVADATEITRAIRHYYQYLP